MKNKYFPLSLLLAVLFLITSLSYAQPLELYSNQEKQNLNIFGTDTTQEKPIQFRRGIMLNENYQSYDEKYFGKDLNEEKRRLFPLQSTGVWTELNPKVPRVDYLGIQFVNKDTGWAVGDLGALIKSTDGGNSWTVSETNTTTPILKVRSYNGQIVIASGFSGLILRSTDGGETFTQVTSNVTGDLWGLQMLNDTLGWSCGNANSLTKTTDGGQTWQRIFTPGYTSDYWWIDFMNESYGFIAANGKVLRTIDGGLNWEIIQAGDSQPLFSIDVIDSLHVAAAGYGGTGYGAKNIYSSDGGYTWINGGQITTESVNCIKYINPDTGYIVLTEVSARKTTNRGQSWTIIGGIDDNYELQFLEEDNIGYSVGTILKINKAVGNLDVWNRLILNDTFSDVYFTSESTGYVASRWFYKTTNSGLNWIMSSNFPTNLFTSTLGSLTFIDSLTGLVGGPPCRIVKTTNAGDTWYLANRTGLVDTIGTINKIFFINTTTGWAVTSRGGILKTTDGGDNWFAQFSNLSFPIFTSIYFADSLYGWASCFGGRPFKTTNGGENWVEQTNLNITESRDVYFSDSLYGWIINANELYYTTNSGSNWVIDPQIYTYSWHFAAITDSHYIITGGNIYESADAGQIWENITSEIGSGFTSLQAPENYLAYGVGTLGYIVSYLDTSIVPVELINFSAAYSDDKIHLHWVTATETNNYGFEVLRSNNIDNWEKIRFVIGHGTTTGKNEYSFIDEKVYGNRIYYKLKQIDFDGSFTYSEIINVEIPVNNFSISQNYPNPANPLTNISFALPKKSFVKINLYSVNGELIKQIINDEKEKGIYNLKVNLNDFASGVYFYIMTTNKGYSNVKKLILLK